MVKKIYDNIYEYVGELQVGDLVALRRSNNYDIYEVIGAIDKDVTIGNAISKMNFIASKSALYKNFVKDRDPTPDDDEYVQGTLWYNYKTGETFTLLPKIIDNKAVWEGDKGTFVCADTSRIFDFFGDGSAVFLYEFNDSLADTGGQYNLQMKGDVKFREGIVGKAAYFNGNSYCYSKPPKFTSDDGALSIWIKPKKQLRSYGCIFHLSIRGQNTFSLWIRSNNSIYTIFNDRYSKDYVQIDLNKWHHIVLNSDSSLYLNGKYIGNINNTIKANLISVNEDMLIGADRDSHTSINDFYRGTIEEARFFNRLLTQDEVTRLYNELAKNVNLRDKT